MKSDLRTRKTAINQRSRGCVQGEDPSYELIRKLSTGSARSTVSLALVSQDKDPQ